MPPCPWARVVCLSSLCPSPPAQTDLVAKHQGMKADLAPCLLISLTAKTQI